MIIVEQIGLFKGHRVRHWARELDTELFLKKSEEVTESVETRRVLDLLEQTVPVEPLPVFVDRLRPIATPDEKAVPEGKDVGRKMEGGHQ